MGKPAPLTLMLLVLAAAGCRQPTDDGTPAAEAPDAAPVANVPDADINASLADIAADPRAGGEFRFAGRWASELEACGTSAWTIAADALRAPSGGECRFGDVRAVPGGYDIEARCTADGAERDDEIELRFAESAGALLVESEALGDIGLVACPE